MGNNQGRYNHALRDIEGETINPLIYITSIVLTFEQNVLDFIQYCHYLLIFFNSLKF